MGISQIHLDFSLSEIQLNQSFRQICSSWISNEIHRTCKKRSRYTLYQSSLQLSLSLSLFFSQSDALVLDCVQKMLKWWWFEIFKCFLVVCLDGLVSSSTRSAITICQSIIYTAYLLRVADRLESLPADLMWKAGYNLDRLPISRRANTEMKPIYTHIHTYWPILHVGNVLRHR